MNRLLSKEKILGYLLDGSKLYKAQATSSPTRLVIESLSTIDLVPDVKPLDILPKKGIIAAVFPSAKTLVRTLELQLVKTKDIDATFVFEAEPLLPFEIEKCVIEKIRLSSSKTATKLQLFAVLKENLKSYLETLADYQIDPEILCPKALALSHFVERFLPQEELNIIIDIAQSETTCVLISKGKPILCRTHPHGIDTLELADAQSEEAVAELHSYLREIARILLSFQHPSGIDNARIEALPLLFTGSVAKNPTSLQLLAGFLNRSIALDIDIPKNISLAQELTLQDLLVFAAPIGSLFSYQLLQKEMSSCNLRKEEFAFTGKWLRWKNEVVTYFCLMALITLATFFLGRLSLEKGRVALVEKYAELLAQIEKSPQEMELITAKTSDTPVDITTLSSVEIDERLSLIEKELASHQEEMVLHPDIPRVSDLLAWLSNHPQVVGVSNEAAAPAKNEMKPQNGAKDVSSRSKAAPVGASAALGKDELAGTAGKGAKTEGLKLESLTYTLVKRPEKGKLKEHYALRVELEFSAPTATMAREFHDALLAPNAFIDPKNELKWSVQRGRYKATFFLKDRTQYPQTFSQGDVLDARN